MYFLDKINSPKDMKDLSRSDLEVLAEEIRKYIIDVVSVTGGHLSSNLGVVELTIALHYILSSAKGLSHILWHKGHAATNATRAHSQTVDKTTEDPARYLKTIPSGEFPLRRLSEA